MNTQLPSTQHSERELGTTVRSRYRLDALLGRGAMGSVYRAWDLERRADCAVKLLQTDGEVHEAALLRFRDEARMAARIFHPHVVEILDHGVETSGSPFLVMELLRGRDLDAFLKTERQLSTEQTIEIVTQVGSALHAVHQVGIVHRELFK
jgi:serine/threonine protein kinase